MKEGYYQPTDSVDENNPPQGNDPVINWEDKYTRLYAEFENYKKRTTKEKFEAQFLTKINTMDPILDLHDELRIAMGMTRDKQAKDVLNIFVLKFTSFLKKNDVKVIPTKKFDPDVHEAITVINDEKYDTMTITNVISNGYTMGEKIIRYPKVVVSCRKE